MEIIPKSWCCNHRMRRDHHRRKQKFIPISISITFTMSEKTTLSYGRSPITKKNIQQIPLQANPQKNETHLRKRQWDCSRIKRILIQQCWFFYGYVFFRLSTKKNSELKIKDSELKKVYSDKPQQECREFSPGNNSGCKKII